MTRTTSDAATLTQRGSAPALTLSLSRSGPVVFQQSWWSVALAAIDAKAASPAGAGLGALVDGTLSPAGNGGGVYKTYQHGWIMWRAGGALAVYGAIGGLWKALGGTNGFLGWPQTDELSTGRGTGRYNHFDGGSIYWSGTTGAHVVYGAIREKWFALAAENSGLGLPLSDEEDVPGVPGARRNRFEGGEITWTPWAGTRITALNVPANAHGGGLTIQNVGNGGAAAPAPQVSRHVIITGSMDITDDETFGSNEHGHKEQRDESWVDSWDPQGVMKLIGKAGGEVRVELAAKAAVRPDGGVRVTIVTELYEGTSEESDDLDGTTALVEVVPRDGVIQIPIRVRNDDEGGDFADILLTISNSAT